MLTYVIIAILIILIGVLSYFASAWFGVKPSNTDKIPPYYENLLRHSQKKERIDKYTGGSVNEYEIGRKR
ncbi:hypothetical protein BH09BAC4_BH09BAC4_41760 [soil metagenome]